MKQRRWWWPPLLCLVMITSCGEREQEAAVARVDGVAIRLSEVGSELRAVLWRRGEAWDDRDETVKQARRQEALNRCVEQKLLANFAPTPTTLPAGQARAAEEEFQQFLKQFEPPEGWKPRLEMQGVNEVQVRDRMTEEEVRGDAIEDWLKTQRSESPDQTEAVARSWFETHREAMRMPDRATVSHLFLTGHDREKPDRSAEIAEIYRRLIAGEATLEALAAKFSEDARSKKVGGSLGWISRDRVPVDFAERVFSQPLGKPGAPFRTTLGWHIVVVHERQASRLPEFAEVRGEIVARLDTAWREAAVKRLMEELRAKAKVEVDEGVLSSVEPGL